MANTRKRRTSSTRKYRPGNVKRDAMLAGRHFAREAKAKDLTMPKIIAACPFMYTPKNQLLIAPWSGTRSKRKAWLEGATDVMAERKDRRKSKAAA